MAAPEFTIPRYRRPVRRRYAALLIAVLCLNLVLAPLAAAPAHAFGFGEFTVKDEIELGKKFRVLVKSRLPIIEDPEIADYVRELVARLQAVIPPQPFPFETSVVLDNNMNAFATPGGYVFVYTGLLLNLENESEVAGVLAHELAHVTQRHVAKRIEAAQKVSLLSMAGLLAGLLLGKGEAKDAMLFGTAAATQAAMLNYSRTDEREADQMGMQYLIKAGFSPWGLPGAFKHIQNQQWRSGGGVPQYLSTHPDVQQRIQYLSNQVRLLPAAQREIKDDNTRFRRIQTLIRARFADQEAAMHYFNNSGTLPPELALMGKGIVYARQNKISTAAEFFDQAVSLAPSDALVLREAGRFHYNKGDSKRAAGLLQRAVMSNPHDLMALFFFARLLADNGQVDKAVEYYRQVLQKLPEDSEVHYYYGRMLGENNRLFEGHLQLAYSALYANNKRKVEFHRKQAETLARTEDDKAELERFDTRHAERAEFW